MHLYWQYKKKLYPNVEEKDWPRVCAKPYVTALLEKKGELIGGVSVRLAETLAGHRIVFVDLLCCLDEGSGLGQRLWSWLEGFAAGPVGGFILAETVAGQGSESGQKYWASKLLTTDGKGEGGSRVAQFLFLQL